MIKYYNAFCLKEIWFHFMKYPLTAVISHCILSNVVIPLLAVKQKYCTFDVYICVLNSITN